MIELNKIYNEDCLIGMNRIPDKSVDMILCDLPYGTTACKWDVVIPFSPLWEHYERVIKDNGAIVLTGVQPFTSMLVNSNPVLFRYEWIWQKDTHANFLFAKKMPLKKHENILVFYKKLPVYNPQMTKGKPNHGSRLYEKKDERLREGLGCVVKTLKQNKSKDKYPSTVQFFQNIPKGKAVHKTQKPIPLFSYLIRTYTNHGDLVLDNCMGSGTTAIACIREGRNYIGFEWSPSKPHDQYYKIAMELIEKELRKSDQLKLIV